IVMGVLREEARSSAARMLVSGEEWRAGWDGGAFTYSGAQLDVRAPWLGLPGRHQSHNAGAACAGIEQLGDRRFTPAAIAQGLRECVWPGRLQKLKPGPLAGDGQVWIDAAHNPGGAAVLAQAIRTAREGGERVAVVLAIQAVKDIDAVVVELVAVA